MKTTIWFQMMMAFQYMKGRKLRTLLTTLAIVFGVAMIFAFNLVLPSAMESLRQAMESDQDAVDLNITSVTDEAFAPDQPIQVIRAMEGVAAVTGILHRQVVLPEDFNPTYSEIELIGIDPTTIEQVREYDLSAGRFLTEHDTGVLVASNGAAEVGDSFSLLTTSGMQSYEVVGVLREESLNPDVPRLLISLHDAQTILNQPGLINLIQVRYALGVNADRLKFFI